MARRPIRVAAATAAIVVSLAACGGDGDATAAGPPVPDRSFATLDGASAALTDYAGEPMVVNFFASWSPPCVAEMPALERVHLAVRDKVRFVGLNTQDALPAAQNLVEQTGVSYDVGLDPDGKLFGSSRWSRCRAPSSSTPTARSCIGMRAC